MTPPSSTDGPRDRAACGVPGATCALCGRTVAEPLLTWSSAVETRGGARRTVHYCDTCSRENVRAIEGKLDQEWW